MYRNLIRTEEGETQCELKTNEKERWRRREEQEEEENSQQ
jgi:hypothetical protein